MCETEQKNEPDRDSASAAPIEINFDGLRSAVTPINLMFDGKLYKDLKGLITHITHASKKASAARPDYQAALSEIDQLDLAFRTAMADWEQKLTGEIQRLKTTVGSRSGQSLGATKQINKYQAELNRGRASARTMPSKISQVRNQIVAVTGAGPIGLAAASGAFARSRLSKQDKKFPVVYANCVKLIHRKVQKLQDLSRADDLALRIFSDVSEPPRELGDANLHRGVLYYLHALPQKAAESEGEAGSKTAQFATVEGMNDEGSAYQFRSVFPDVSELFAITLRDFETLQVDVFEPLAKALVVIKLLRSKFRDDGFLATFGLYHTLRKTALANNRDEKFNPKQLAIHEYLTKEIFDFVGIEYQDRRDEIRFIAEINRKMQNAG